MAIVGGVIYHSWQKSYEEFNNEMNSISGDKYVSAGEIVDKRNKQNSEMYKYHLGCSLIGVGSALVTVSIPLFVVGDHRKREANKECWSYK